MLETESKIKIEAKRLKLQHEAKKKLIEKKLIDSETQLFSSSTPVEVDEDPLDAFMRNLAPPATAETKPKNRAKTKLSEKLSKAVEKAAPRHAIRIKSNEILDNESLYESKDLVIKEETSWLDKMRAKKREIKPVDHAATAYASFQRNFYIESPEIAVMTESEVDEYRKEYLEGVKIRGRFCPRPIKKWSQCGFYLG